MGFVRTDAEIARITQILAEPEFRRGEALIVRATTTPEFLTRVLPPGLEPTRSPEVRIAVTRFRGGPCGPYSGGTVRLRSRLGDTEGGYVLAMYMDTDEALLFGRELFGEPKKMCRADLRLGDDLVAHGHVERGGERLIEVEAELGADAGPSASVDVDFNYKASLSPDGHSLAGEARLVSVAMRSSAATTRPGRGRLVLRGTPDDPFHELPIDRVSSITYVTDVSISARLLSERGIPGDAFLPYALGRLPDWARLAEQGDAPPVGHGTSSRSTGDASTSNASPS